MGVRALGLLVEEGEDSVVVVPELLELLVVLVPALVRGLVTRSQRYC